MLLVEILVDALMHRVASILLIIGGNALMLNCIVALVGGKYSVSKKEGGLVCAIITGV